MKQASDRAEAIEAAMAPSMEPGWKRSGSAICFRGRWWGAEAVDEDEEEVERWWWSDGRPA